MDRFQSSTPVPGQALQSRIHEWLRQFESEDLIDAAFTAVENVRLIGRTEVLAALGSFLDEHNEFHGAYLCPLGGPKDSSSIITYYAGDLASQYRLRVSSLADALVSGEGPILFLDDFISSGAQAVTIVENWLGEPLSVDLKEDRGQPLGALLAQSLRDRRLGFVFSAGSDSGAERLHQRATELGLAALVRVHISDSQLPRAFGASLYASAEREAQFRAKCQEIGTELLLDLGRGHDAEWVAQRALGYGNNGYLVIFPYNTPSQTLTCLWASGVYRGSRWAPPFPRRPKT